MKERIEELARECGAWTDAGALIADVRNDRLIKFANAILELAAKECDAEATIEGIAQRCAAAIRKLKV